MKKSIEKTYPAYARLRNDLQGIESQVIQSVLDPSELLLKYFLGERTVYIFSIHHSGLALDTVELPANFRDLISSYRETISDLDLVNDSSSVAEQEYLEAAYQLFRILLEKPLGRPGRDRAVMRLTIIADDLLNTIPFQAFLTSRSDSWLETDKLLVAKYAVNYLYFCKMRTAPRKVVNTREEFVTFGLEFDDQALRELQNAAQDLSTNQAIRTYLRSGKLSRLPFSDDEAKELANLLEGQEYINADATKTNFLKFGREANFIHLATHSIIDEEFPNQSALIFAKTQDSLGPLLRIEEIYGLSFEASMIVLSSCSSGFGKNQKGEGLNSLARAFNFSGIPSIMATFWNISDEASKKMMLLYYGFLKEGHPKDIALQKAQLAYLTDDEISSPAFRKPVYWAAWKPIGQRDRIYRKPNWPFRPILFATVIILFVGLIYFRSRKIRRLS